jgi:hypothetical protein
MFAVQIDRRFAGLFVALLLAVGIAAAPAQLASGDEVAQTHARHA